MKKFLVICAVFLSQAAIAADVFDGAQPRPFKLADQLELDATIGSYPIWQGEKKWRLYDIVRRDSSGMASTVPLGDVKLFQTEGGKFVAAMTVSANLSTGSASDWNDEPCKREDLLFKASLGGKFSNVNCVTLNHITNYPGNPSGRGAELFTLIKQQSVEIPPTVLQFAFTRYASNLRRLSVTLSINPELAGFERASEIQWGRSPWHSSQALNEPKKKKFVEDLGVWALQFAKQMDMAFEKKSDAFTLVPSWRSVIAGQQLTDPLKPKVMLD